MPDAALSLLPLSDVDERPVGRGPKREPKQKKRGPALAHCEDCRHPIWDPEYATRPGGPRGRQCGGRIGHPRPPAAPKAGRRPVEDVDDQLELFAICVIKVWA